MTPLSPPLPRRRTPALTSTLPPVALLKALKATVCVEGLVLRRVPKLSSTLGRTSTKGEADEPSSVMMASGRLTRRPPPLARSPVSTWPSTIWLAPAMVIDPLFVQARPGPMRSACVPEPDISSSVVP